jgi:hypothetical protein
MPRFPKRLLALGALAAGGVAAARRRKAASAPSSPPMPAPTPASSSAPAPPADTTAAAQTPIAPPPVEAPGPSVTPPGGPASDTERAERADATTPDPEALRRRGRVDELVEAETAAAAAEARGIGGPARHDAPDDDPDPALDPVYEAGGGEQEGFELAERDLVENATHGDGRGDPSRDAIDLDAEAQEATWTYGEADEERKPDE